MIHPIFILSFRYAAILLKTQRDVSRQQKVSTSLMVKDNLTYEIEERIVRTISDQQLGKQHRWIDTFSLISFSILFFSSFGDAEAKSP